MASGKQILVVDDDPIVRDVLVQTLTEGGFQVTALPDGQRVTECLAGGDFVLAILDLTLPDQDGLALTRRVREHFDIGIIIVSGRGEPTDRVIGLEIGADDYLPKPFLPRELIARVRSVLRRSEARGTLAQADRTQMFTFLGWTLDLGQMNLKGPQGENVYLTSGEFKLLQALVTHANRVLSRDRLMEMAYENDTPAFDRSIDVRVARLRKKLGDDPEESRFIKTVRNSGYVFVARVASA